MAERVWILVDGNSLINRAYYGLARSRRLSAPDGRPTAAVYTFLQMLFGLQEALEEHETVVCFDMKGPTFRHAKFPSYKTGRRPTPEDLLLQIPMLKEALDLLGIRRLEKEGYEADDLIGSLAKQLAERGERVQIFSGDRDLWQLISEQVTVLYPKGQGQRDWMDEAAFETIYPGLKPAQLIPMKGLMGDSSDAIPGVKGIGEKGALDLIQRYHDLDGVYAAIDEIKGARKRQLIAHKAMAYLSEELATICVEVPLDFASFFAEQPVRDREGLTAYFQALGFQSLIERLGLPSPETGLDLGQVKHVQSLARFFKESRGQALALYGSETQFGLLSEGLRYHRLDLQELRQAWGEISKAPILYTWDLKGLLRRCELPLTRFAFVDLQLTAYLLNQPSRELPFAPLPQAEKQRSLSDLLPSPTDEELIEVCAQLFHQAKQDRKALEEAKLLQLAEELEFPLLLVLARMEREGIQADEQALAKLSRDMEGELEALEGKICELAGTSFNLHSPKQMGEVLFERLGLEGGKKLKSGGYSTAADELKRLEDQHPIIPMVQAYRELSKLKTSFVDVLAEAIEPDGRIRSTFHQSLTSTGRLSSSDPNLQNIPTRSARGKAIREVFQAKEGCVLMAADYSQVELRLLAHLSEEPALKAVFLQQEDLHLETAQRIFQKTALEISPAERNAAKTVNFSIVYGISPYGLARDMQISQAEAKRYIAAYHALYPNVGPWMEGVVEEAKQLGYVQTLCGRRRYVPELKSGNYAQRQFGERAAMNAPVQGTAADLIKLAMLRVAEALEAGQFKAQMILQIHDELLLEVPEEEVEAVQRLLQEAMEGAMDVSVPLKAEVHVGKVWGDL